MKPSNQGSNGPPKRRLRGGEQVGVGNTRYTLLRAAAHQVHRAIESGFYLEATTLLESLIAERLEKRAQWLWDRDGGKTSDKRLERVKDGFASLGDLTRALADIEPDTDLRSDVSAIDAWRKRRNDVIHEMAKFGLGSELSWEQRHEQTRQVAADGIPLLLTFDQHERRLSHGARNKHFASATCPDAFAILGQEYCDWCAGRPPEWRR